MNFQFRSEPQKEKSVCFWNFAIFKNSQPDSELRLNGSIF